jgi:hypothetical protein
MTAPSSSASRRPASVKGTARARAAKGDNAVKVRIVLPVACFDRDGGAETRRAVRDLLRRLVAKEGYSWRIEERRDQGVTIVALYREDVNELGGLETAAYALEELRRLLERTIGRATPKAGGALADLLGRTIAGVTVRTEKVRIV